MELEKLEAAEAAFMDAFPLGFGTPVLAERTRHHDMTKLIAFARRAFSPEALRNADQAAADMVSLVARSSMVSRFEKPHFREAVRNMTRGEREELAGFALDLLHGNEALGMNGLSAMLAMRGIAKWPVVTALRCYYDPVHDLIIKPTTVKNVIAHFGIQGLRYTPVPNFAFYDAYRAVLLDMRAAMSGPLRDSVLAGFSGFLMMSTGAWL
jgi:hypothetical protein